jgi:chromosome partitioning protein
MSKVINTINIKGDVCKTQMTVALAEFLAMEYNKKVFLIDLGTQINTKVSLMDKTVWLRKTKMETLFFIFLRIIYAENIS